MKVFVTGATGFVGQEILARLRAAGYFVRILARNPDSERVQELFHGYGVEVRVGNILEPASLAGALEGMNAVIHLVGIIREFGQSTFENVHALGTENVVAAAEQATVVRFIHMSALGTRPQANSRYHQTKWAGEEAVRRSDLDYTIFRPSLIFGPQDAFVNLFARLIRWSPVVPVLASERTHSQPVHIETVASAFVRAVAEPKSIGQTFDLCGPQSFTLSEIVDAICAASNRKRLKIHVPLPVARWQAKMLESIYPKLFRKAAPLNRDQILMLQEDNVGNPEPANQMFSLQPVPFREGIDNLLKWPSAK